MGQISRRPIMNDSGSQTNGTDCVLLTTEGPLRNAEWWDNGIRFVDKKEHSVSYVEDGGGREWEVMGKDN